MKKIGVIVNQKRSQSGLALEELRSHAQRLGFELYAEDPEMAGKLGARHLPLEAFGDTVDVAFAMGGDGTVLYTALALHGSDVPIMGINLGSLGFLTSVGDSEMIQALEAVKNKTYKVSVRDVAECRVFQDGKQVGEQRSLNDIVIGWGASSRINMFNLSIDGEPVCSFMCDGMIVSTPTGSTAHSLSAGGPIIHPELRGFGINVICPHTLSSRPLVIPNSSCIEIEVVKAVKELILSIDGQDEFSVEQGDRIEIRRSEFGVKFLQLEEHSYFSVLAQKLHWRGSSL